MVAQHGTGGTLSTPRKSLTQTLKCTDLDLESVIRELPNVTMGQARDGRVTVTYKNWHKYQRDSSAERTSRYRERTTGEAKDTYLKHVHLSKREHGLLVKSLGAKATEKYIALMDEGEALKGYGYKSHYLAILKWYKEDSGDTDERRAMLERMKKKEAGRANK
jgi:hypothetical protein